MGKRLIRIFNKEFSTKLNSIPKAGINIVLEDKSTLHGSVVQINKDSLLFKDTRNTQHTVLLNTISEIVYDIEASY